MDTYKEKFGVSPEQMREELSYMELGPISAKISEIFEEMSALAKKRVEVGLSEEEEKKWEALSERVHGLMERRGFLEAKLMGN